MASTVAARELIAGPRLARRGGPSRPGRFRSSLVPPASGVPIFDVMRHVTSPSVWRAFAGVVLLITALSGCGQVEVSQGSSPGAIAPSGPAGASPTAAIGEASPSDDSTPSPLAGPCRSEVDMGVLPTWARAGFAEQEPAVTHVSSRSGDVVAILFGYPLTSPPRAGFNNKILWVHRDGPTSPVEIVGQRMEGLTTVGEPVVRRLDGGSGRRSSTSPMPGAGGCRLRTRTARTASTSSTSPRLVEPSPPEDESNAAASKRGERVYAGGPPPIDDLMTALRSRAG